MVEAKKSDDNLMAAAAYFLTFITGAIIYLTQKDKGNKFVLFHAMQSILYGVAVFAIFIVLMVLQVVMMFIPYVGWMVNLLLIPVFMVVGLGNLIVWVFLMYKAYSGEKYKLPFIGNFAESKV